MNTSKLQSPAEQAEIFTREVKIELVRRGLGMGELATLLDRPRSSVSKAVNQFRFPLIRAAIVRALKIKL